MVILGDGKDRATLEALVNDLGVASDVALPRHVGSPSLGWWLPTCSYRSSIWEGFVNVLAEALTVGTPVVATDCPSGPHKILQDSRLSALVTPGDADALASTMTETLDHTPCINNLDAARSAYTIDTATDNYARVLRLKCRDRELS